VVLLKCRIYSSAGFIRAYDSLDDKRSNECNDVGDVLL
jgi:hypothetical protein